MAFTSANHREEFSCSSHSYSGYSPSFHSSLAYDLSSSLSPGGCSSPVPPLLPSSLLDSPSLSSSSLLPPPLCVGFSPGSSSLSSHISQASSPSSFSSLPLGVASPPLPLTPCANDSPPPCSPPFSSSPLSSSSPSPGASSLLSSSLPPAAFSPSGATPSYAFAALASAASSLSSLPPLGSSSQPAPLTAEEIRALPFLCSRVYVEFSADAALPPEVRLALRYPHGYELGVSGKKPKVGKLEQVAKPEKGREARPRRCKAEDVKENAGANAAKHRKESGGPDADKHTQASPACTEKVPERQGGGRSDVEEEKRGFYSAGERKPGQKTRKEEDSSMFDTDADTMEGWIDAIIQLHDIQNEERQALVVTNHYAGIFSSKRVVLTYTSHEFSIFLLLLLLSLKFRPLSQAQGH
uniref:Uncharacterized protein n=1 Tax=Toxoplasma gondii TgCATBr9 TaxID=943120 RepID=A0A2T6IT12_TOXGO|nr:hypothetical protein TGBR9_319580A [Toxoplasma gondii TgCATBr9]